MSIFVYFDEHGLEITNLTRHDRLKAKFGEEIGAERFGTAPLSQESSSKGRSAAHPRRYAANAAKPG